MKEIGERAFLYQLLQIGVSVVELAEQLEHFGNRKEILQRRALELNARFGAKLSADRLATEQDRARGGRQNAFHDLDGRRLTRTVGAE